AAGRSLEQANTRRIAATDHVSTGHVEGETLPRKEHRMSAGSDVLDTVQIARPGQLRRVERTRYREPAPRPTVRRPADQPVEHRLTVGAVGAEIAEIPMDLDG